MDSSTHTSLTIAHSLSLHMSRSHLLALPLELRYCIYRALITTFLIDRRPADLTGIFLSCRQIQKEMEDEYISRMRPLLGIMHRWNAVWEEAGVSGLRLTNSDNFEKSIQITEVWLSSKLIPRSFYHPGLSEPALGLVEFLRSVCLQSHSTFTLSIVDEDKNRRTLSSYSRFLWLFRRLRSRVDNSPLLGHLDRLVLEPSPSQHVLASTISSLNWTIGGYVRSLEKAGFPAIKHTWAAKEAVSQTHVRWSFGFDFKDGLPEVRGTVLVNDF